MGRLRLVGSLKLYVSFAKEPYKTGDILQKRPIIVKRLLIVTQMRQGSAGSVRCWIVCDMWDDVWRV